MLSRFVAVVAAALSLASLGRGSAFADPQPAATPVALPTLAPERPLDPYAKAAIDLISGIVRQQFRGDANRAEGDVTYFRRFDLHVRTGGNTYRNVRLHRGTQIDPRGATIERGDRVAVGGVSAADGSLEADTITILR